MSETDGDLTSKDEDFKFDLQLFAEGGDDDDDDDKGEWGKFLDQSPDEYKRHEAFKGMKNLGDLQKSYLELQEDSKGSVKLLGENASDEEVAEYRKKAGVPETKDGYELTIPAIIETLGIDKSFLGKFNEKAHSLNLTKAQAGELFKWYNDGFISDYESRVKEYQGEIEGSAKELKDEWGDDYDENVQLMKRGFRAVKEALGKENGEKLEGLLFDEKIDGRKAGNHPLMIRAFHYIGKNITGKMPAEGEPSGADEDLLDRLYPSMKKFKKK